MKFLSGLALLALSPTLSAWEPSHEAPALPMDLFNLPEGLEIKPWALSPALFNPTNMDFDHLGRAWVCEGVNYRSFADRRPAGDRIVILEDTNGDGQADSSKVFWQDPELVSPLGIAVFDNVVIISQPPNLLKLTDVNRDSKFDLKDGDVREVLLTGFNGKNHDHSLHSLTAGPDGKWYFNQGNACGVFTDHSGKTFRIGSEFYQAGGGEWPIDTKAISGQASDDGFVYVGGFTVRMNPDGTHAEVIGHGYRNSYEQTITSRGHVFQNDNDDPPACRTSHVIEHGNAGYFSNNGKRSWHADQRPGQDTPTAHWRQEDPGSMPAGDIYGGGSPTGIAFYENGAFDDQFIGTLLSGEAARNVIFSYQPAPVGAGFKLEHSDFLTTNPERNFSGADFTIGAEEQKITQTDEKIRFIFRPADVCIGPDGAIYVADWTDPRVGGHDTQDGAASGVIYRIAPTGFKSTIPTFDLATIEGAITALKSPAVNVRSLGFEKLKAIGTPAYEAVAAVLKDSNPYIAARAIWLLPYLGENGKTTLDSLIADQDSFVRLTAFRAIRRTDGKIDAFPYALKLSTDSAAEVRAEAASAVRYLPFAHARQVLINVAKGYDGKDRSYLEILGLGAGHHTAALWSALVDELKPGPPEKWTEAFANLTWRLKPVAAIPALKARASDATLSASQRKQAMDSIAFIHSPIAAAALMDLATPESDLKASTIWWLVNRAEGEWSEMNLKPELENRGLIAKPTGLVQMIVPAKPTSHSYAVAEVLALKGDAAKGKIAAGRCIMCHQIDQLGVEYGPALKGFGSRQPPEVIAKSLIDPSADIAHGYEGSSIKLTDGQWIDGQILADGDPIMIRSTGGLTQKIPTYQLAERYKMDRSLMLSADQLGLTAQDVADIIEWMKSY